MHAAAKASRAVAFDAVRVAAVVAVIAIHVSSYGHSRDTSPDGVWWWTANLMWATTHWAVPVFVMISGAFVLGRYSGEMRPFYRRRVSRVLLPAVFWIAFYLAFRIAYLGEHLTARQMVVAIASAQPFIHLYFLYVIVGLYLITPLLATLVATGRAHTLLLLAVAFGVPAAEMVLRVTLGVQAVYTGLSLWLPYVGYFVAGALLVNVRLSRTMTIAVLAAFCGFIALQVIWVPIVAPVLGASWREYSTAHTSVILIGTAITLFVAAAQGRGLLGHHHRASGIVTYAGSLAFGVYLVSEAWLAVAGRTVFPATHASNATLRLWLLLGFSAVASFVTTALIKATPYLRRLV